MSTAAPSLLHQALLHGGTEEFLDAAVPFLREGFAAGDHILAVLPRTRGEALRDVLGKDGSGIGFLDSSEFYRHPVRTIAAYHDVLRQTAPRRLRALAELNWSGRLQEWERREWYRYEALVNAVFNGSNAQVICSYDRSLVPPPVVEQARRTHPELFEGGFHPAYNDRYTRPERYDAGRDRLPLPEMPADADRLPLTSLDLAPMRSFLTERALRMGLPEDRLGPLCMAVNEIATNAVAHGTPPIEFRIWRQDEALYCEVADIGLWHPDPLAGFLPPESAVESGFGLWSARLLVDLLEIRAGHHGTRVRLRMDCPASA
ncbi:sensor histidine kinase [Actinocorallia sp. B10E7]|uniref:sensor histidine kinase n=1 Tax=Actinocorallia sp. B10E7 TaxID=3153558 RepID=UPI00325F919B